jgi:hypothetical protein
MTSPRGVLPIDFCQYYAGGIVVRDGLWQALYPIPKPGFYDGTPDFHPLWESRWFRKEKMRGTACYYPAINIQSAATLSPELLERCPELRGDGCYYAYPPPLALLLRPLASFSFEVAAHAVWPYLSMAALWGMGICAASIHRLLKGRPGYTEGAILLTVAIYSISGYPQIQVGNVTPILGFGISLVAWAWLREKQILAGTAMIPLILFKGIGVTWCPLLLLGRIQWKTLLTLTFWTLLLNGVVIAMGGIGVYHTYFREVLPHLTVPAGTGLASMIFRDFGVFNVALYQGMSLGLCGLLYYGYWRSSRGGAGLLQRQAAAAAAMAGCMAVYLLLNFSIWGTYYPNYLFFPFLGWLLWERQLAAGAWRAVVTVGIVGFFLAILTGKNVTGKLSAWIWHGPAGLQMENFVGSLLFSLCTMLVLLVAYRRLLLTPPLNLDSAVTPPGETSVSAASASRS